MTDSEAYSDRSSVRAAHEDHVTGFSGCQWYEVVLCLYPLFPSTLLINRLLSAVGWTRNNYGLCMLLLLEVLVCVVPAIAVLTLLQQHLITVAATLTILATIAALWTHPYSSPGNKQAAREEGKVCASLTLVRGVVGLGTAIAILAVDFHVFPRRFAKTEEFGFSPMDTGAAGFLLINAVVDVKPSINFSVRKLVWSTAMLLLLGFARLLSVSATDYQHHVSEYGTHSNFFFVLAATKMICLPVCRALSRPLLATVGMLLTVSQHFNTVMHESWVLGDAPRDSFMAANRESLVAMPGYAAIYCWGALLGKTLFLEDSTNITRKSGSTSSTVAPAPRVLLHCSVGAAFCALVLVVAILGLHCQPSRRMVNATFVVWMVLIFLSFLALSSLMETYLSRVQEKFVVPIVLQAINKNQLLFFLASNLLTGAINLSMNTLDVKPPMDTIIISAYTLSLCLGIVLITLATGKRLQIET